MLKKLHSGTGSSIALGTTSRQGACRSRSLWVGPAGACRGAKWRPTWFHRSLAGTEFASVSTVWRSTLPLVVRAAPRSRTSAAG
jgi:hypothetical protein